MDNPIYCINLGKRTDKWSYAQKEFKRAGINNVQRFEAFEGKWRGCRDSHLRIMQLNQDSDKNVFIFEDDPMFLVSDPCRYVNKAMMQLPDDWDMLYLGGSPQEPQKQYSDNLFHAHEVTCMHAYIINNRGGLIDTVIDNQRDIAKIDIYFAHMVQDYFKCFLIYPLVCTQKQFDSDTCYRSDVSTIAKNYSKYVIPEQIYYNQSDL